MAEIKVTDQRKNGWRNPERYTLDTSDIDRRKWAQVIKYAEMPNTEVAITLQSRDSGFMWVSSPGGQKKFNLMAFREVVNVTLSLNA